MWAPAKSATKRLKNSCHSPTGFVWKEDFHWSEEYHHPVHLSLWFPIPPTLNIFRHIFKQLLSGFPLRNQLRAMGDFLDHQASFIIIHGWVIPGSPEGIRNIVNVMYYIYICAICICIYIYIQNFIAHLRTCVCERSKAANFFRSFGNFVHLAVPTFTQPEWLETDDPGQTVLRHAKQAVLPKEKAVPTGKEERGIKRSFRIFLSSNVSSFLPFFFPSLLAAFTTSLYCYFWYPPS